MEPRPITAARRERVIETEVVALGLEAKVGPLVSAGESGAVSFRKR
jgi:hypothetical protein